MNKILAIDWLLVLPSLIISFLSLLIIFSIDKLTAFNQLLFLLFCFGVFLLVSKLDIYILAKFHFIFYLLSLILLIITFIIGKVTRGSVRWIEIVGLNIQTSELVKPLLIISFSVNALRLNFNKLKEVCFFMLMFIFPSYLIFKQPDLGSTIIIFIIWFSILMAKGINKYFLITGIIVLMISLFLGWGFLKTYQKQRLTSFLDPQSQSLGAGYNVLQAVISIGSGSIWGRGLGGGTQNQLLFLPERHTDFLFASFSEELGFLGATLLIIAYFVLCRKILAITAKSSDKLGKLIGVAVFVMVFSQFFINIGMNLGVVPVTGITLPLFSAGGSSLLSVWICLGMLNNLSLSAGHKALIEIK